MPNHTTRLHFSPDSKQLVVGLSDCSLNLWDVDSMAHLSIATEKKGLFIDAAFISNTAELAYCVAGTTTTTHIMNAVSGECEKTMTELADISIDTHTHSLAMHGGPRQCTSCCCCVIPTLYQRICVHTIPYQSVAAPAVPPVTTKSDPQQEIEAEEVRSISSSQA